jgi:phospho-N-acetylmuramoyl-pentapeptide-transferase
MSDAVLNVAVFAGVLVLTLALGGPLIRALGALKARQRAYDDAPKTHASKTGTPTMGGILFVVAIVVALVVRHDREAIALGVLGLACGGIGFIDDYLAIRGGTNRGLRARTKLLATGLAGAMFLALLSRDLSLPTLGALLTFGGPYGFREVAIAPHWVWLVLSLCAVVATTHAVNLTDGLDGLAAGTMLPPLAVVAWLAARIGASGVTTLDVATAAACLGFLAYNRHPAKLFMGDTGSLALGGILAGSAIIAGNVLLLPLIGGVFAAETLSVMLQVTYFKRTRKRIFRMSPLHHHFELGGWPETKVTTRFWTASALLSLAGAALAR